MNTTQGLRMKFLCVLLLLRTTVSALFERNDTMKSGSPATMHPESGNMGEIELRSAADAHKFDKDRAEFIFHSVMVGFIIVGSVFLIAVALLKALHAPKDKEVKSNGSLDVEKQPWV